MPRILGPTAGLPGAVDVELDDGQVVPLVESDPNVQALQATAPPAPPAAPPPLQVPVAPPEPVGLPPGAMAQGPPSPEDLALAQDFLTPQGQAMMGASPAAGMGVLPEEQPTNLERVQATQGQIAAQAPAQQAEIAEKERAAAAAATPEAVDPDTLVTGEGGVSFNDRLRRILQSAPVNPNEKKGGPAGTKVETVQQFSQQALGPVSEEDAKLLNVVGQRAGEEQTEAEKAAVAAARAPARGQEELARAMDEFQTDLAVESRKREMAEEARQKRLDMQLEQKAKVAEELAQAKDIDPDRYYGERGTPGRIMAAIGQALAAFGSGLTGAPNTAAQIVAGNIDRDIEAQKADLAKKRGDVAEQGSILADMRRIFGDEEAAEAAAHAALVERAQAEVRRIAAESQSEQTKASAKAMEEALEAQKAAADLATLQAARGTIERQETRTDVRFEPFRGAGVRGGGGGRAPATKQVAAVERTDADFAAEVFEFVVNNPQDPLAKQLQSGVQDLETELRKEGIVTMGPLLEDFRSQVASRLEEGETPASVGPLVGRLFKSLENTPLRGLTPDEFKEYRQTAGLIMQNYLKQISGAQATDAEYRRIMTTMGIDPSEATPEDIAGVLKRFYRSNAEKEASIRARHGPRVNALYQARQQLNMSDIKRRDEGPGERVGRAK